jgi:hypothetical protein
LLQSLVLAAVDDARDLVRVMCQTGEFDPGICTRVGDELREPSASSPTCS